MIVPITAFTLGCAPVKVLGIPPFLFLVGLLSLVLVLVSVAWFGVVLLTVPAFSVPLVVLFELAVGVCPAPSLAVAELILACAYPLKVLCFP